MDPNDKIEGLHLPFEELILEEIFFIPSGSHLPEKRRPITIYDLAAISARPLDEVMMRLKEIRKLSDGVSLSSLEDVKRLLEKSVPIFDVRPHQSYVQDPIRGAKPLPSMTTDEWKREMGIGSSCLVFSDDGRKAFSAAMWLREQGVEAAHSAATQLVRAAMACLVATLLIALAGSPDAAAADGEAHEAGQPFMATREALQPVYTFQFFMQRPSLKILWNNSDEVDQHSDRETFDGMNYEAESMNAAGIKASWKDIGILMTRLVGSRDQMTTHQFEDYQLSHYGSDLAVNLRFQRYHGMVQRMNYKGPRNTNDSAPPTTNDRSEEIRRPESSVAHRSLALRYMMWSHNFSLREAFGEPATVVRRGYGFPLFIAGTKTEFDTGGTLTSEKYRFYFRETSSLKRLTTDNVYLGGGAAGMIPFGKFFMSGQASFGAGVQSITVVTEKEGGARERRSYDSAHKADLGFVLGFNLPRGFATLSYDLEGTTFRDGDIKATVQSDMVAASTGVRF